MPNNQFSAGLNDDIKVVLFGKTGAGKSTIGNMLLQGELKDKNNIFPTGQGIRGVTLQCKSSKGRGYNITDLVGIGETENIGKVPNKQAIKMIYDHVATSQDAYNHVCFVIEAGRFDEEGWRVFAHIFRCCDTNFIIIVTNADEKWVRDNSDYIKKCINRNDIAMVGVKFPWGSNEDAIIARQQSLQLLESALSSVRCPASTPSPNKTLWARFFCSIAKVFGQLNDNVNCGEDTASCKSSHSCSYCECLNEINKICIEDTDKYDDIMCTIKRYFP